VLQRNSANFGKKPPKVDISHSVTHSGNQFTLELSIKSKEDNDIEVSVIYPDDLELLQNSEISFLQNFSPLPGQKKHSGLKKSAICCSGKIAAAEKRTFVLNFKKTNNPPYKILIQITSLTVTGTKEKQIVIGGAA